jgi:hypothetical protein
VSYKEMSRRLAELEDEDQKRHDRVCNRVLERLSNADLNCFTAYLERRLEQEDEDIFSGDASAEEWRVLCLVEHLTLTDPEVRSRDLMGIDGEMMREHGYEVHL